ncbi:MAG: Rrf2 family transcriptional regulator [Gemmatimonadetes bacterium]|nr:Rrf2 family transcriptional regulator [Gemmatimonadota bacterium]MBT8403912.1 Rrf2 family transcriptional regulator [Gemmatimonadota bacterium]NNF39409.1 Rrf2 family transcriptional regulator [Gemmatimonadota bacterium]
MISSTSKYALRVLVALVGNEHHRFVSGADLSAATGVPSNYLAKVLGALGQAGLVDAVRGRGGGYRLARTPHDIRLIDAVEIFEGPRTHPTCLLSIHADCSDDHPCSAHEIFRDVRSRYIAFLEDTSIAEAASTESPSPSRTA